MINWRLCLPITKWRLLSPYYQVQTAQTTLSSTDCTDHTNKYGLHSLYYQLRTAHSTLSRTNCTVHTTKYGLHTPHYQVRTAQSTLSSTDCTFHTIKDGLHSPHHPVKAAPSTNNTHTATKTNAHRIRSGASRTSWLQNWPFAHCVDQHSMVTKTN